METLEYIDMETLKWIDGTKCPDCGYQLIDAEYHKTDTLYGKEHKIIKGVTCSLCGYPYKVAEIYKIYERVGLTEKLNIYN